MTSNRKKHPRERRVAREEQRRQLKALAAALPEVIAELKLPALLDRVVEKAVETIPEAQAGSLLLIEGDEFVFRATRGYDLAKLRPVRFPVQKTLRSLGVFDSPRRIRWQGIDAPNLDPEDWERMRSAGRIEEIRVTLSSPILLWGRLHGWINVDNFEREDAFDDDAADLLQLFAAQVSVAVHNARLYEELSRSESRYRNLFESAQDAVIQTDREGRFIALNHAAAELVGSRRAGELVGGATDISFDPEERRRLLQEVRGRGFVTGALVTIRRRGRPPLIMEVNFTAIRDAAGSFLGMTGVGRDVTEKLRLEEELRYWKAMHESAVESLAEGIVYFDRSGRIEFANAAVSVNLGLPPGEIAGMEARRLLFGGGRAGEERGIGLEAVIREGAVLEIREPPLELEHRPSGQKVPAEIRIQPRRREDEIIGGLAVLRFVTEEARLLAEKERLREQLMEAEKLSALGRLVGGVAHELNNPLTGVLGFTELLLMKEQPPETAQKLARIHSEADRCRRIIQSLMAFARRQPTERTRLDLNRLVREAVELQTHALRLARIETVLDLAPALPQIEGDEFQLRQVIVNLVANAQEAMASEGRGGRLLLRTRPLAGAVGLEVIDTGPGILRADLRRIFDPFFTTKQLGHGAGLGLSLAYGVVTEHGGRIWADTEPGKGAAFHIELPLIAGNRPEERRPRDRSHSSPQPRLLIVVNEPPTAASIAAVAGEEGYEIEIVSDGKRALDCIDRQAYERIIVDLELAGPSAVDLYREVLRRSPHQASRFVFVGAEPLPGAARAVLCSPGCAFVGKPFEAREIREALQRRGEPSGGSRSTG